MEAERLKELEDRVTNTMKTFSEDLTKVKELMSSSSSQEPMGPLHKCLEVLESGFLLFQQSVFGELAMLQTDLSKLQRRQDDLEQYSRRNCLLLMGVPEAEGKENEDATEQAVLDVINTHLELDLAANDIERTHRLGSKKKTDRSRPIIIKFWSYKTRARIFSVKSKFKSTNYRIAESLTKTRMAVLKAARDRFGVHRCWTSDGKILFNIGGEDGTGKRHVVTSLEELAQVKDPTPGESVGQLTGGPVSVKNKVQTAKPPPIKRTLPTRVGKK